MLDSTSTGLDDPVVCGALRFRTALHFTVRVTLVFQKRYFVDHLRLQIVAATTYEPRSASGSEPAPVPRKF